MKNKGQVEVQFNWIFILIVGAIILSFFVVIAMRQKQASEASINVGFFISFEKALSGISAAQGKTLLFEVPSMELNYECTQGCDCAAFAGTSRARASASFNMKDKIIFSPNKLRGNNLLTMSKDWSYPFRITNFLFITSPEVKYLIEDTKQGEALYDSLPLTSMMVGQVEQRAFDKQLFKKGEAILSISGNYKVKFVFLEENPEDFPMPSELMNLPDKDVTAIKIVSSAGNADSVIFYQKQKDLPTKSSFKEVGRSYLFGEASLFGAIFSEDLNSYACMMNRAFKKYEMISMVYSAKQQALTDEINKITELNKLVNKDNPLKNCLINYERTYFDFIVNSAQIFDFKDQLIGNQVPSNVVKNTKSISSQNDNAIKGSCPQIY